MSKYTPLKKFLEGKGTTQVPMTFAEVERVLGSKLPPSAYSHPAWWSNHQRGKQLHVQAKAWLEAGYQTEQVNPQAKKLVFKRSGEKKAAGMSEAHRNFEDKRDQPNRRHPMIGALKGTFWIDPNWDLTKPALDPKEWEEIQEEMNAKFDRLLGK